jgi:hypothetical protein
MRKLEALYVKYLIKTPALFYAFLFVFIGVFLMMSASLKLDVVETYDAVIEGDVITIHSDQVTAPIDGRVYFYTDRNERVYQSVVERFEASDGAAVISLDGGGAADLSGGVTVGLIVGEQSLLARIFVRAGKS